MGKSSPSSCLKIIVCGSDSVENDDVHSSFEAKTPNDKRGWSFRKRSGKHQVLGNNVSSETTTFADREAPQGGSVAFQAPVKSACADEKPHLPKSVHELSIPTDEISKPIDEIIKPVDEISKPIDEIGKPVAKISKPVVLIDNHVEPEASVVVVPSGNGARSESEVSQDVVALESTNNETSAEYKIADAVVTENDGNETSDDSSIANELIVPINESTEAAEPKKSESGLASEDGRDACVIMDEQVAIIIQTAMRGFLAQRKFVQLKSAVKLQAVIRGHLVRRNAVATLHCIKAIVKVQALVRARSSKSLDQKSKPNDAQFSTVKKLLQNSFTHQLLESTSKPKSLNIRCDPLKPNSAWSWLERWMSVSTSEAAQKLEPSVDLVTEDEVQKIALQADAELSSVPLSESLDYKLSVKEGEKLMENDEHHITDDFSTVDAWASGPLSTELTEQSHLQEQEIGDKNVGSAMTKAVATKISRVQAEQVSLDDKPASSLDIEKQTKLSTKRSATSDLNGEGKKFIYGSRKASNPAFIAAQSKFEELTLAANPDKATNSSHDVRADSHVDSASSPEESVKKSSTTGDVETSGTSDPQIHVAASECATELSISSTLDSPDRSDIENAESVLKDEILDEDVGEQQEAEANGISSNSVTGMPSITFQPQVVHEIDDVSVEPVASDFYPQVEHKVKTEESGERTDFSPECHVQNMDSSVVAVEQKHQENGYNMLIEHGSPTKHQAYKSSPEASPISHKTVPESQGTPSSQASVRGKMNKIDKHGANRKRSSPSAEKRSLSNTNIDLGARSSTEHIPKDHKSGKRRNSFGSTKSENADQEPRDSSSRNTLPSYMQATESAKAKAHSPRSSPDIHDKEVYSKKRNSLPGASRRHGSPHVQRSTSHSAQGAKGNVSSPSNERKWLR